MSSPVFFYGHRNGPFAAFSNWYPAEFEWKGVTWATSEHAFMSQKAPNDKAFQARLADSVDPADAKKWGRKVKLRSNWDQVKYDVMIEVCYAKFSQNPELRDLLLSTGDRVLHEDCPDPWWGGGPNYPRGRDLLGKALMKVRSRLQREG